MFCRLKLRLSVVALPLWISLMGELLVAIELDGCQFPLGMESRRIADTQITASSSFDQHSTGPSGARIRTEIGSGAWCPLKQINATSPAEWIQVELAEESWLTAVETQGRWDYGRGREFVTAYMIEYWRPSLGRWARYRDYKGREIVTANIDTKTAVKHQLSGGVLATLVRIIPVSEQTRTVCLRIELYGCPSIQKKNTMLQLESYSILDGHKFGELDGRDENYDGLIHENGTLSGGLGRLYDGVVAGERPGDLEVSIQEEGDVPTISAEGWVAWHRGHLPLGYVPLELDLVDPLSPPVELSAISMHMASGGEWNFALPRRVIIYFIRSTHYGGGTMEEFDLVSQAAQQDTAMTGHTAHRWVRLPLGAVQAAHRLRLEIYPAEGAEWVAVSEISLEGRSNPPTEHREEGKPGCWSLIIFGLLLFASSLGVLYTLNILVRRRQGKIQSGTKSSTHPSLDSTRNPCSLQLVMTKGHASTGRVETKPIKIDFTTDKCPSDLGAAVYAEPNIDDDDIEGECLLKASGCSSQQLSLDSAFFGTVSSTSKCCSLLTSSSSRRKLPPYCSDVNSSSYSTRYRATPHASFFDHAVRSTHIMLPPASLPPPAPMGVAHSTTTVSATTSEPPLTFTRERILAIRQLGGGKHAGSTSWLANLRMHFSSERLVVMRRNTASNVNSSQLMTQIKLLTELRHHNLIKVIGMVLADEGQSEQGCGGVFSYLVEYMPQGSLPHYFRSMAASSSVIIDQAQLLSILTQLAAGMAYLESMQLVHGELCCRNCYVDAEGSVKVGEFGLDGGNSPTSIIRWMAWECALEGRFTSASDVWSFAVCGWEIYSLCEKTPFGELDDQAVWENLQAFSEKGVLEASDITCCYVGAMALKLVNSIKFFSTLWRHLRSPSLSGHPSYCRAGEERNMSAQALRICTDFFKSYPYPMEVTSTLSPE